MPRFRDLASYQEVMATFHVPALNDRFDMLRQLGNTFIVQPNVLKSYMTESHLGRIDTRLLRPYLSQRSDWSQFSRTLVLDDGLPVDATPASTGHTPSDSVNKAKGGVLRNSRLSLMSGVAGTGMGKLKEMLKEFEALSPEEAKIAEEQSRRARVAQAQLPQYPLYMGMH